MKKSNTVVFPRSVPTIVKKNKTRYMKGISDITNRNDNKYLKYIKYIPVTFVKRYKKYKIHYCVLLVPSHIFQKQDLDEVCFENRSVGALVLCL